MRGNENPGAAQMRVLLLAGAIVLASCARGEEPVPPPAPVVTETGITETSPTDTITEPMANPGPDTAGSPPPATAT